jgi:pimeloyl-ACP methyl ester carboxylesterase
MFPSAKFVYVPNAGHWVHADNPEHFLDVLAAYVLNSTP